MTLTHGDLVAGRFTIDHVAGSGGMGTVYRARDQLSGGWVALKLLNAPSSDGSDSERFAREAQILSELQHSGIVAYVGHGQTPQGLRFLAMQWLEGEDLAQRLTRGALPLPEALLLTQKVAEALAFAHTRGVLHRDLKPTNLFLPDGDISRVKILDFGIARKLSTSRAMTRTGMIVGTRKNFLICRRELLLLRGHAAGKKEGQDVGRSAGRSRLVCRWITAAAEAYADTRWPTVWILLVRTEAMVCGQHYRRSFALSSALCARILSVFMARSRSS